MRLGYNTNGMAHHNLLDAIALLGELGYGSLAITIDHGALNPYDDRLDRQIVQVRRALQRHAMHSVIETGARFLLDPYRKHEPTLMSALQPQRQKRLDFLFHAIDIASQLSSDCVSFWTGTLHDSVSVDEAMDRLCDALRQLIDYAAQHQVTLALEPEPGMFVDTMARYERLLQWIDAPHFRLTMDVGHLYCQGELPIADYIRRWATRLVNVHVEDMRAGKHEHLMFGEGEMDFPPIIRALAAVGYQGGVHVELSRHCHEGPAAARRAYEFLAPMIDGSRTVER